MKHKLVKEIDGQMVNVGDKLLTFRGELVEVLGFEVPRHDGSTGRVNVRFGSDSYRSFFPSVIGCEIVSV
jgi:hypothetical protein